MTSVSFLQKLTDDYKTRQWDGLLLFLSSSLLLLGIACSLGGGVPSVGKAMPDFRLETLEHGRFYLNQQKGNVVVLVFWATWCRACKTQMVELGAFTRQPDWHGVHIAAICTDPENLGEVKNIASQLNLPYPVLLDDEARLFHRFGLTALPTTILIDGSLKCRLIRVGYDTGIMNQIKTKVAGLLAEQDASR